MWANQTLFQDCAALTDEQLDANLLDTFGTIRDIPKTVILTQVINHATEHRSQVMVTMTQLGIQPPEIDIWQYFDEIAQ